MKQQVRKTSLLGAALGLALIISYVEFLIPFNFGIVGFKLGLTNILVILILKIYGLRPAICVNVMRILLSSLLFGNIFGLALGLSGGVISTVLMYFLLKIKGLSEIGVSAAGGTVHNLGQLGCAAVIMNTTAILKLTPLLMLTGLATGILCGIAAHFLFRKLEKVKYFN